MLAQEQQRRRLADHVRTSDDDHALAGDLDPERFRISTAAWAVAGKKPS